MTAGKQISLALSSYSRAFAIVFSKKFIAWLLAPLVLNIVLFWIGFDIVGDYAAQAKHAFSEAINFKAGDFWAAETIGIILSWLVGALIYVLFFIIFAYTGGYIVIIILSPVFAMISEKAEKQILNQDFNYPFSFKQLLKDIFRGIRLAIRNFLFESLLAIVFFIIGFIPVIGWLGAIFMFFISAYFFGFSFFDFTNERHRRNVKQSILFAQNNKWATITNGALFSLVLFIPFIGVALSAFIAVISVVAGTITVVEIEKHKT